MVDFNHCDSCVTDKSECIRCRDNPIYKDIPTYSLYQAYIPTCPKGYVDRICDPAYIKYNNPKWYVKLFGDKTPEEASKTSNCQKACKACEEDPNEEYYCYDNEDK